MYFQKKYLHQVPKQSRQLIKDLDYVLDNIWCTYSFIKGKRKWREIEPTIPIGYANKIYIEISHVEIGHGREQALMATKSEMEKFIEKCIVAKR